VTDLHVIEPLLFEPPSEMLFTLLDWLEQSRHDFNTVCGLEYSTEELYGFGELNAAQMDQLLTWGTL
jgi:hypothetical protein